MKFNKHDLNHANNLIKSLSQGQFTLTGIEVLAFASMMRWFGDLQKIIEKSALEPEAPAMVPKEVQSPMIESTIKASPTKRRSAKKEEL